MNNEHNNQPAQAPPCFIHSVSNCPPIRFFNCDNIEFMKSVPDKYYDLAIVDPPYGIGVNMNMGKKKGEVGRYEKKGWDSQIPPPFYFTELQRVSKNQIIWGGNYFTNHLDPSMGWIIWNKEVPDGVSFSDFEMAWSSFNSAAKQVRIPYCGFIGLNGKKRIHPTEKPVILYRWLLQNYAVKGMKILDTHGGSMNISHSCEIEGFSLDIMEIDPDYFRDGVNAFKMHIRQHRLF